MYCSLDSDGDQYPEVPVRNCTASQRQQAVNYCVMDSCPTVFNLPNNDTTPCNPTSAEGTSDIRTYVGSLDHVITTSELLP